jgi:hypothetical protein
MSIGRWGARASEKAGARDLAMDAYDGGPGSGPKNHAEEFDRSMAEVRKNIAGLEAGSKEYEKNMGEFNNSAKALGYKARMKPVTKDGRWGGRSNMATDPPVSEPQRKAMFAAAAGKSTLGIPKKVGEEFVGKAKDGGLGSGPQPGKGGGERREVRWPSESEIAGRKRQQEIDLERATLNAGGLPKGWRMIGGRKVPPAKDGRWGGRARDSVDTRYRSTDEYNPPFQYERGQRVI